MIKLVKAVDEEKIKAMDIINEAKAFLKSSGVDQWQNGYPDMDTIVDDIKNGKGYFISYDDIKAGYLCIDFGGEPAYDQINGKWLNDEKYAVIHRMAISDRYRGSGAADKTFELVENMCREQGVFNIRIDTDKDNMPMQSLLKKKKFQKCGSISFDGSDKIAFQKVFL